MEKKRSTCIFEKFFNSLNHSFRSYHPQVAVPPVTVGNPSARPPYSVHSGTKAPKPQTKPSTTVIPSPIKGSPHVDTPEKKKFAEAVPIKSEPSQPPLLPLPPPPQPSATPHETPIQESVQVAKVAPNVESVPSHISGQETNKPKTKDPPRQAIMEQEQGEVVRKAELLRMETGKGEGRKKWDVNEKVTNYIEKTKTKLRTRSSIDTGNSVSFKEKKDEGKKKWDVNEKVGNYIERTKIKLRTSSGVGAGKSVSFKEKKEQGKKKWDVNEKVSTYIERTKIKLRTSSGVGAGKSASFKVKEN